MVKQRHYTAYELTLTALFTALIAIGAFLKIPVPLMDYFTLQFLFVLLAGLLLGARLGGLAVLVYLLLGLVGLPIFAAGGGISYLLRPSFGYLIGFLVTAYVVGYCSERQKNHTFAKTLALCFLGMVITYVIGFGYKYLMLNFYIKEATGIRVIVLASLPLDIPGDCLLCIIAAAISGKLRKKLKLEGKNVH